MNKLSWILAVTIALIIVVRCHPVIAAEDQLKQINTSTFPLYPGFHWDYNYVSEDQDPDGKSLTTSYGDHDGTQVKVNRVEKTMAMKIDAVQIENGNIKAEVTGNSLLIFPNPESIRSYCWVYQPSTGGFWEGTTTLRNDFVDQRPGFITGPPMLLLPSKVGRQWGEKTSNCPRGWEVAIKDTITVPAGTLKCYRLDYRTKTDHQTIWFSPDIGIIKMEYVNHGKVMNTFIELTAYGPKK